MCVFLFGLGIMFDCYTDGNHDTFLPSIFETGPGPRLADETLIALYNYYSLPLSSAKGSCQKVMMPWIQDGESLIIFQGFRALLEQLTLFTARGGIMVAARHGHSSFHIFWNSIVEPLH